MKSPIPATPKLTGFADSNGAKIYYEVYGDQGPAVLMLPPWQVVSSRVYRRQIAYLSLFGRIIVFDPRGNGRTEATQTGYSHEQGAADALAVLDTLSISKACMVARSRGSWAASFIATTSPHRVDRLVLSGLSFDPVPKNPGFKNPPPPHPVDWEKFNADYWRTNLPDFLAFFFERVFPMNNSSRQRDEGVQAGMGASVDALIASVTEGKCSLSIEELLKGIRCPTMIIHGVQDAVRSIDLARHAHSAIAGSRLVELENVGHNAEASEPVLVNTLLREFLFENRTLPLASSRKSSALKRALFYPSPWGRESLSRGRELQARLRERGIELVWLLQPSLRKEISSEPHPMSDRLADEKAAFDGMSRDNADFLSKWFLLEGYHVQNFMLIHELQRVEPFDAVLVDSAWDFDWLIHKNAVLKTTRYVWMGEQAGRLPAPDPGSRTEIYAREWEASLREYLSKEKSVWDLELDASVRDLSAAAEKIAHLVR